MSKAAAPAQGLTFPAVSPHRLGVVLPVLVHIQTHLDEDLSTAALAGHAELSAAHFSRLFASVTGETVKSYTLRLRLERAAYRLLVEESTVLSVAVDCGFASHEVFARAFRRRFGVSPSAYRRSGPLDPPQRRERRPGAEERLHGYTLSATRARVLRSEQVVFLRHIGPYETVDVGLWSALQRWAESKGLPAGGQLLGVGHDAPGVTSPERLRFDACLQLPGPVPIQGRVGAQSLGGGLFAVTTHIGPLRTLGDAYGRVFERSATLPGYRLIGLPVVEVYSRTPIGDADTLNSTEIRLPLARS